MLFADCKKVRIGKSELERVRTEVRHAEASCNFFSCIGSSYDEMW